MEQVRTDVSVRVKVVKARGRAPEAQSQDALCHNGRKSVMTLIAGVKCHSPVVLSHRVLQAARSLVEKIFQQRKPVARLSVPKHERIFVSRGFLVFRKCGMILSQAAAGRRQGGEVREDV